MRLLLWAFWLKFLQSAEASVWSFIFPGCIKSAIYENHILPKLTPVSLVPHTHIPTCTRTILLRSHKEPTADQGQAGSKSFNRSKNQSQISEVYSIESKDTRIVEKRAGIKNRESEVQKCRGAEVQKYRSTGTGQELKKQNRRASYTISQINCLTENRHRLHDQRSDG